MQFIVYDKTGENIRCTTRKLEYSGTFMGECSVTMDITSPTPIDFHIGDYVEYRGERFEINYDPSVIKTARRETVGDAFKYENIKFNSLSDELVRADFLDYVSNDNNIHFTALPTFSFFCSDVRDLAQRIQANLDRVYTGSKKWTVSVHGEFVGKKDVSISVSNIKVWDALALASSDFDANFIIRGRTITIGTAGIAVGNMFSYGKNNGLFEIERSAEPDQAIITRLRAYGSEKNLPPRYYNKLSESVPNNMAVTHLMLPDFPLTTLDPYIDSANITQLGIREGSVFFDGSNGNEEIYPSIEGMTYQGVNIDEVQSAEQTTDDGIWEVPEGETSVNIPNFTITLYDLGFDIRDYLIEGQNPVISMKSGLCAGREFEIVNVNQDTQTGYYTLECRRVEDSSLGLVFPYKDYNVKPGDKFVLLYISMPTQYITAAAQRLYDAAVAYLAKNDYVRYSYSPKVDNIFLQRQHDTAIANSDISIHDTIKEGDLLLFNDTDLGISGSIIIDQLTIKEGDELIPQYEITLRNDKTVGTIQRLQQQIDSIVSGATAVGGYNSQQIQSIMRAFGDVRYLRKDIDDVSKGLIDSLKGFQVGADFVSGLLGEGGIFRKEADGKTYIEADRLYVRLKAYFDEIEVKKYTHSGGNRIASKTGVKTVKVEWLDANGNVTENDNEVVKYRCYFRLSDNDGNTITNDWVEGDLARSQEFKDGTNGYWRAVVGVGATADDDGLGYIDLSNSDCLQDSDIPQAQDDIIQLGNKTNADRQGAIIEFSSGANAPSYQIYQNINSYDLTGKNVIALGYNSATDKAYMNVYGDAFIGDQNGSHIQYNSTTNELTIKATIDAQSTIGTQTLEEYIQEHQTTWTEQEIETLITDSTSEQFADIDTAIDTLKKQADGAIETWFYNGVPTLINEPASTWTTTELKDRHLGDLYYDNQSGYAYRFTKTGSTYSWNPISDSAVAKALSDAAAAQTTANSKRRIFFVTPTPPYEQGDLWVNATYPANNTYTDTSNNRYYNDVLRCKTTKASGSFSISDWTLASKYTDDSKFNSYIDQLLNHTIISNPSDAQQVANTYNSVMQALNQGTIIEGGLVLSTLIGLRDSNNTVWAGMSGAYDTQAKGNGIASWYGGAMVDWETLSDAQKQAATDGSYAKSLFRMDGTGYMASGNISWDADGSGSVAGGNISWDANGRVTLKNLYTDTGKNIDQLLALFSIGGTIPTNAYITPAYPFSDLQVLTNSGDAISVKDYLSLFIPHYNATTGELESIESPVPLWSRGEVSALGYDDSGGGGSGGGTDLAAVWTTLTGNTGTYKDYQIHSGHLTSALANYALSSSLATVATTGSYNDLTNKPTIPAAQIQSDWNQTTTTAKDYIKNKPTIPAAQVQSNWNATSGMGVILNKPTKVSAFTNDANYVTSSSLTTTLASYATTSAMNTALNGYLPLAGGTMKNTNVVTNLNADLLDGVHLTSLVRKYPQDDYDLNELGVDGSMYRLGNANTNAFTNSNWGNVLVVGVRGADTCYQLGAPYGTQKLYFRTGSWYSDSGTIRTNPWKEIAFTDSNVASATTLETSRTLWGQNFDGSANVSGDMTGVGNLTASGNINVSNGNGAIRLIASAGRGVYDVTSSKWLIGTNGTNTYLMDGNVGIGTTSPTHKLHVEGTGYFSGLLTASGNIKTASYIEIGDYRIVADTANTALKVVNKDGTTAVNFYATGENSALGVNTSGGGGGGGDGASLEAVWTSLGSSTGTYGSSQINASHLTNALNGYATQTWVNQQGFLTSYTETDPVFKASAAHGITSANITSWNNKVSNVQADWNATSGLAVILNKPTNLVTTTSLATTLQGYVTALGTNDPYITWTRNGVANNILPPSAYSLYVQSETTTANITSNKITYTKVSKLNAGSLPVSDNTNVLLNVARTNGSTYGSQLAFSSTQYLYFRAFGNASADTTQRWKRVAFNEDWEVPYTIGSWSKIIRITNYGTIQLSVRLAQSSQSATYMFLVTTSNNASRCYQIASGNYASNSEFAIRVTRQSTNSFDVEIKSDYAYGSATTSTCYASWIVNGIMTDTTYPSVSIYTEVTAGGGTVSSGNFTTVRNADLVNATIYSPSLHLTASDGTAPMTVTSTTMVANLQSEYASRLKTSRTLWGQSFDGSANVSGNMTGVGSIAASDDITVTKSDTSSARMKVTNGNGNLSLLASTNRGLYDDDSSKWLIATNGTNTFMLHGNVGINTTSPSHQLHVNGNAYATNIYLNGGNRFGGSSKQLVGYIGDVATLTIEDGAVRRSNSNANIILGTSTYRWANVYSVLGNFSGQITSSVATGTSPLHVASTTLNANLNADLLDGYHATELARLGWTVLTTWNTSSPTSCIWREIDAPATSSDRVVYDIVSFVYGYPYISYYRLTLFSYGTTHLSVSLVNLGTAHRNSGQSRICVGVATDGKVYIQNGSINGYNFLYVRNILSTDSVSTGTIHTDSVGEAAFGTANGFTAAKIITDTGYCRVNRSTGAVDTFGDPSITTSLRIGDACIWWDETNNCLRITGANANGLRSTSVAVNVNVSGEVSALKTS